MEVELGHEKELPNTVVVEPRPPMDVHFEPSLLMTHDHVGILELTNTTGFTQQLPAGTELGTAMDAMPVLTQTDQVDELTSLPQEMDPAVNRVRLGKSVEWRRQKLYEIFKPSLHLTAEE